MKTIARFEWAQDRLEDLKKRDLYRKFHVLESLKGASASIGNREITLFCGNDYLGLSQHRM